MAGLSGSTFPSRERPVSIRSARRSSSKSPSADSFPEPRVDTPTPWGLAPVVSVSGTPSRSACETSRGPAVEPSPPRSLTTPFPDQLVLVFAARLSVLVRGERTAGARLLLAPGVDVRLPGVEEAAPLPGLALSYRHLPINGGGLATSPVFPYAISKLDRGQVGSRFSSPALMSLGGSSAVAGSGSSSPTPRFCCSACVSTRSFSSSAEGAFPDEGLSDIFTAPLHGDTSRDYPLRVGCQLTPRQQQEPEPHEGGNELETSPSLRDRSSPGHHTDNHGQITHRRSQQKISRPL